MPCSTGRSIIESVDNCFLKRLNFLIFGDWCQEYDWFGWNEKLDLRKLNVHVHFPNYAQPMKSERIKYVSLSDILHSFLYLYSIICRQVKRDVDYLRWYSSNHKDVPSACLIRVAMSPQYHTLAKALLISTPLVAITRIMSQECVYRTVYLWQESHSVSYHYLSGIQRRLFFGIYLTHIINTDGILLSW